MVGVAGRSKGCNTCRKRRVKCDEAKPQCYRCLKAGFECLGYERATQWRHTSIAPRPASNMYAPEFMDSTQHGFMSMSYSLTRELSLVAFEKDVCTAHMFSNFVWRSYGCLWLDQAAEGKLGDLSFDAVRALAQLNFGLSNRAQDLQLKGVAQYGRCLRVLAEELGKDGTAAQGSQRLVVPILVLMMVSAIQADRTAAVFHLKAIRKVLTLCGPEAFQLQPLRNAFEAARATLLVASLFSRRRTFLEEPHWQDVPWALDPLGKSAQSQLLDILVTIPGLLEEDGHIDDVATRPSDDFIDPTFILDEQLISRVKLCGQIAAQLERLYHWRWDWQYEYGQCVTIEESGWQPNSPTSRGSYGEIPQLQFGRSVYANDIMLYNAALMWLMSLLWKLEPSGAASIIEGCAQRAAVTSTPSSAQSPPMLSPHDILFEPLRRPGASYSIRDPAIEICRAFDWQCRRHEQHAASADQTCLYLFPLGMARAALDDDLDAQEWMDSMLDTSPITAGYGKHGGSVVNFGSYITKLALDPIIIKTEDVSRTTQAEMFNKSFLPYSTNLQDFNFLSAPNPPANIICLTP
ncbi:hypothetical protein F4821DRAFT_107466 [Hypoxylon rubiginosum]|uniref:Uncharacterized protein n=1 Tax=Hypoxylon rubiginosum TaxID=110542 RepID=A0ACC0D4A3_9PEZI|nr:hypothetical protein F4821DRAFT_107466 [Hypoxylon rubiginosum]